MKTRDDLYYWPTFIEARDWAAKNVKGYPGWRVTSYGFEGRGEARAVYVVQLMPGSRAHGDVFAGPETTP